MIILLCQSFVAFRGILVSREMTLWGRNLMSFSGCANHESGELDGEQGAFEWLAEDWGHREGQGQERGGSALATSWTPGDPQHHCGGGKKAAGARPEKGCHGECWRAGQGQEVSRSRLCWRLSAGGREKGLPPPPAPTPQQGRTRLGQGIPAQNTFFMWVPRANSQSQALD